MSDDLRRALDALAAEERAAAAPLPVADLRGRAHRRRTTRTATTAVLGVAAVAAVAVAAAALPDRGTMPPARTPTADAWPSAVTLDGPVPGCGDAMPALVMPDGEPEIALELELGDPIVQGGSVNVGVMLTAPEGFQMNAAAAVALLVRDGVVVAVPTPSSADGSIYSSVAGEMGLWVRQPRAVPCAPGDGTAFDAGTYDLYVLAELLRGDLTTLEWTDSRTVVGGPVEVTIDPDPAVEDLVITPAGLGPLMLGESPAGTPVVRWDGTACAGTDVPGRWVAAYPAGENAIGGASLPFTVQVLDDRVVRVEVHTPGPRTISGIQVGSTLADVRALHPELTLLSADGDVEAWGVTDGEHTFAVEVAANPPGGGLWSDAEVGRVLAMVAAAGPYDHPAWGADTCG